MPHRSIARAVLLLLGLCFNAVGAEGPRAGLTVKAIAAGAWRSLALASDGTVWEWGKDSKPQWSGPAPVQVHGLTGIVAVAGTGAHNLAVKQDGTVWAWGGSESQQYPAPVQIGGLTGIVAAAGGYKHSLALQGDGTVWAWGRNGSGQLGDGTTADHPMPVQVDRLNGVVATAAGNAHSLALKGDGTVWAWGFDYFGQLGDGTTTNRLTPVQVSGLTGVVAIAAGDYHSLALKGDGTVWAWGRNGSGQLGDGTITNRSTPVQVGGVAGVVAIAAGSSHSLAVKGDGTVWAWGSNWGGQLGDGTTRGRSTPVQVGGLTGAVATAGGQGHSLALASDGTIWAWGWNENGQLGDGTTGRQRTRIQVSGLSGVVAAAGGAVHSLALKSDGTVWAWGNNQDGQLGDGTTTNRPTPAQVSGLNAVVAVAAGSYHSVALKDDGTVWVWGSNGHGQLGDGTPPPRPPLVTNWPDQFAANRSVPGPVTGLTGVVAIAAGGASNLALKSDGTVWAWGAGDLGDGTTMDRTTPVQVSGLTEVVAVAMDGDHSLALKSDGTVWAWGGNEYGQLGVGTTTDQLTPLPVSGLGRVVTVAVAAGGSLALKGDGTVWEWGIPEGAIQSTPTQVRGLIGVVAMAGGNAAVYFCGNCGQRLALTNDGTVWAWGNNEDGQLGDGTTTSRMTPARVVGLSGVVSIGAGSLHSLAVKGDGTVWMWGNDSSAQFDGTTWSAPVQVVPPGSPDLAIAMSHVGEFTVAGQGVYTLTITNTSVRPTSGAITVTDMLPPGLAFLSATGAGWTCSVADLEVTCTNPGPISPGDSSTITLTVNVSSSAHPFVTNLATVSNAGDLNASNNAVGDPTVVFLGRAVVSAVVNGASFRPGPIAPGEIVSIFGEEIGPSQAASGQTRVLFDGADASVIFAQPNQVNAVVPDAVAGKQSTELHVEYGGVKSRPLALAVAASAPGIFTADKTGSGPGAILNEDGRLITASRPTPRGSVVMVYATGQGQASLPLAVRIGGLEAEVLEAGGLPELMPGLLRVKARIPDTVVPGPAVPIMLVVGEAQSQAAVTVAVQ